MTKDTTNVAVELTDDQVTGLQRNADEQGTTPEELVNEIVAEWLDRHGTGVGPVRPGGPNLWPQEEIDKAEKAEQAEQDKAAKAAAAERERAAKVREQNR